MVEKKQGMENINLTHKPKLDSVALSYEAQKENSTTSLAGIWCYRAVGLPKNTVFSRKTAIYNKIPILR